MKKALRYSIALATAPNLKTAHALVQAVLEARLAACVNLVPLVESHYWWQGKIEKSKEVLLIMKTEQSRLAELEATIIKKHPYDTPEFLVLSVPQGNQKYLAWLGASLIHPIHFDQTL